MSMTISAVGYYDTEGTFFYINPMNGYPSNSCELSHGVDRYVVRLNGDNNNYPYSTEMVITREQAQFLSNLYDDLSFTEYQKAVNF